MRKTVIHIVLFLVVLIAGIAGINWHLYSKSGDTTTTMDQATLPVIYSVTTGGTVNAMHGYVSDMDASLLRDSVTPLEGTQTIKLRIDDTDRKVEKMSYEVRSADASSLVENGDVKKLTETKQGKMQAEIPIRMRLKEGQDYLLKLIVVAGGGVDISYYTHISYCEQAHVKEQLDFVKNFNNVIFDKKKAETIQKYLEPDAEKVNNDLGNVDIKSSFDAITFAQMSLEKVQEPVPVITEINGDVMCTGLNYLVASKGAKEDTEYYEITENYKVRYTSDRMYLLSYNRTMKSLYDKTRIDTSANSIKLGINDKLDTPYLASEDNKMVAFVKARQLFLYDYQSMQMVKMFHFLADDPAKSGIRDAYDQHDINLISLDKKGNLSFAVYGYMNRGKYEGQNGICFYHYQREENQLEEIAFIPSKKPYDVLEEDVNNVLYMTGDNHIYLTLDSKFYSVNMKNSEVKTISDNVVSESIVSSSDGHLVGLQKEADISKNDEITVMNLEDGTKQSIKASKNEVIRVLGFVDGDLVYGRVKKSQMIVKKTASYYPMYKIEIVNSEGNVVKKYTTGKSGVYVMSAALNKNVLELKLCRREENRYEECGADYIMSKGDSDNGITLDYFYSNSCYNEVYMMFPKNIYITTEPGYSQPNELAKDTSCQISVEEEETGYMRYFVYSNGKVVDSFNNVTEAVKAAKEWNGMVINNKQKTVWDYSELKEYGTLAEEISVMKVTQENESLAACLYMMLEHEGVQVPISELKKKTDADDQLSKYLKKEGVNLTGCTLNEVMYYICRNHPVIARMQNGRYVLLVSYNSSLVKYLDPVTGETKRESFSKMTSEFAGAGNVFYSYLN